MSPAIAWALFLLLLPPAGLPADSLQQQAPIRIGFGCCQFFDPQVGVPTFMHGEELWVYTREGAELRLFDPQSAQRATTNVNFPHSVRLYTFSSFDPTGNWRLSIRTGNAQSELTIPVVADRIDASIVGAPAFTLADGALQIQGSLNAPYAHQGARILLKERLSTSDSITAQISFRYGALSATFARDRQDPNRLTITPFAPSLTSPNKTTAWAELYQEVALSRSLGGVPSIVLVPSLVTRTFRTPLLLASTPQEKLTITLPPLHSIDAQGNIPLRLGRINVTLFLEAEGILHRLDAQFNVLPRGIGLVTVSESEAPPFANPVAFTLRHVLTEPSAYDLVLLLRLNGVETVWNVTLVPPIARFEVRNRLTQNNMKNYTLSSESFSSVLNVDGRTYVIFRGSDSNIRLSITVAGVRLQNRDFEPNAISVKPLETATIIVSVGEVTIRIGDRFGNPIPTGRMTVQRLNGDSKESVLTLSWASPEGTKLTLPVGSYELIIEAEGATITRALLVQNAQAALEFTIPDLVSSGSRLLLALLVGGLVIVTAEVVFAARLWGRIRARTMAPHGQG